MEITPTDIRTPKLVLFNTSYDFVAEFKRAICSALEKKTAGINEIFVEALCLDVKRPAKFLTMLWKKFEELLDTSQEWRTATLSPSYKKGDGSDPSNYKFIAVHSHYRKSIESAIATRLRREHRFHPYQLGFQQQGGTENAIVRHMFHAPSMSYTAVLQLKAAYDLVPRDKLMHCLYTRIPIPLCNMIALTPQRGFLKI